MKAFTDLMDRAGATNDDLRVAEIRLHFITAYSTTGVAKSFLMNPDRALVRYEFMECIVRCA